MKLLDWFWAEKFRNENLERDPWELQLYSVMTDRHIYNRRCDQIENNNLCDFLIEDCVDEDAATIQNYANRFWLLTTLEEYFRQLYAQRALGTEALQGKGVLGRDIKDLLDIKDEVPEDGLSKALEIISQCITVGSTLLKKSSRLTGVGEALGEFGDIFETISGFISSDPDKPDKPDIENLVNHALSSLQTIYNSNSRGAAVDYFGRASDLSKWPDTMFPANRPYKHPTTNFLADGRYLITNAPDGYSNREFVNQLSRRINSTMVALALAASDYYIIADVIYKPDCNPDGKVAEDAEYKTARWIDGHCYQLHHPGKGWQGVDVVGVSTYTKEMPVNMTEKLSAFSFDLEEVYRAAISCQTHGDTYDHRPTQEQFNIAVRDEENPLFSTCIYGLPVLYVDPDPRTVQDKTPCLMKDGTGGKPGHDYLPDNLKPIFSGNFCYDYCKDPKACTCEGCQFAVGNRTVLTGLDFD